ncbi:fimbrial biogenesis chaperone [Dyella sp. 2RAB6]|uniref:fimbrial biogenesis chaperone n=1 Tax=Dyella sp. 2RAB6 TaxID=3232992 RepID=UPI003F900074
MKSMLRSGLAGLLWLAASWPASSEADVIILGTRVIYPAAQNEVSVQLSNQGERPALVQLWIEEDGVITTPSASKAPFIVSPPLARMEGHKGQVVRVLHRPSALRTDRESLFWLNMLEVPPKPAVEAEQNLMQFAVKTRIKLIYRPDGLPGDPAEAPGQLRWSLVSGGHGQAVLQVSNPTPYYVNFASIGVQLGAGEVLQREEGGGKVEPGETGRFAFPALSTHGGGELKVVFTALSDLGGPLTLTQPVAR